MNKFTTFDSKVVTIYYTYADWSGSCREWQEAYFQMLSWKNTWGIPVKMDVYADGNHEAYFYVLVPADRADQTREYMDELGYEFDKQRHWEATAREILIDYDDDDDEVIYFTAG